MKRTSFDFISSEIHQIKNRIVSGFPPTFGSYDWLNWDPHMAYTGKGSSIMFVFVVASGVITSW